MSNNDEFTALPSIVASSFSPSKDVPPPAQRLPSPASPPYSPITPTMSHALPIKNQFTTASQDAYPPTTPSGAIHDPNSAGNPEVTSQHSSGPTILQPPPPQPISMSDNPDAIALRAAMSVLQIQRQQALRDMKTLEDQKAKALKDPEAFAKAVSDGTIKSRSMAGIIPNPSPIHASHDSKGNPTLDSDSEDEEVVPPSDPSAFGTIPSAQNVVRMPPVNWAKYHIVGESLDELHEEQRRRPSPGQPLTDEDLKPREREPEHVIAAPYNPWLDKVGEKPGRTRSGGKKKG